MFTLLGYLVYGTYLNSIGISAYIYFWIVLLINGFVFFEFVLNVLKQGSQVLGINVLTMNKK
jgi:hypothetical protein